MTAVIPDQRLISAERAMLAACVEEPEAYAREFGKGLCIDHFDFAPHRKAFVEIGRWYQNKPSVPAPPDILRRADIDTDPSPAALYFPSTFVMLDDARLERERAENMKRLALAAQDDDEVGVRMLLGKLDELAGPRREPITLLSTAQIFEPVPPTQWIVDGLQLAPGRPSMFAGYGASAKTLSAQQLALALASGRAVFDRFETEPRRVVHFDLEQGSHATRKRYQRLAIGHGIDSTELDDRLQLAPFPSVLLDAQNAADVYSRACEGAGLVIIDSLRAATPSLDENDSQIRRCLDLLTMVSERTGAAFLVVHHAGKPKDGHSDARTVLRGSSAIFDACGSVLLISAPQNDGEPRTVRQLKQPADAAGAALESFGLWVEDVALNGDVAAGLRVLHRSLSFDRAEQQDARFEALATDVLAIVHRKPGMSTDEIRARCNRRKQDVVTALSYLERHQKVVRAGAAWRPR